MTEPVRYVVDGEDFDVVREGASVHHTWVSGPNAGYGFSVGGPAATPFTAEEVRAHIRAFLSAVDPRTGYLAE
ncbi:hypothetical protein G5T42_07820 [Microbacterium sp. 4R-513]|uniref:hypothetical protein n=1 Tax=Microbacterium sp. 4R-513 TaxID=2567934 RepID=UPI0013E1739C|nr:hypothetical protein [Microbacterium sp. 4R-513]QIG39401.1 hypothetical protein G5T42_07820 [Microbacterium sp. 4R-513]